MICLINSNSFFNQLIRNYYSSTNKFNAIIKEYKNSQSQVLVFWKKKSVL